MGKEESEAHVQFIFVTKFAKKGSLYAHHFNTQISSPFDSYINNKQALHVYMVANSSLVCFCHGCFLRLVSEKPPDCKSPQV